MRVIILDYFNCRTAKVDKKSDIFVDYRPEFQFAERNFNCLTRIVIVN